jgi:hypothetical protein
MGFFSQVGQKPFDVTPELALPPAVHQTFATGHAKNEENKIFLTTRLQIGRIAPLIMTFGKPKIREGQNKRIGSSG